MRQQEFKALVQRLKSCWEPGMGVVAILGSCHQSPEEAKIRGFRLSIGPSANGLVAENCILWLDDGILYQGKLDDSELRKRLTANKLFWATLWKVTQRGTVESAGQICLKGSECAYPCEALDA